MSNKGGRPSGELTRCGGVWTEARFNSFVKSLLRAGTRKWAPIQKCLKDARVRRGIYLCASCGEEVAATIMTTLKNGKTKRVSNAIVDHINPVIDEREGFTNWDDCIEGMFSELDNLQCVCHSCHSGKSEGEVKVRAEYKRYRTHHEREYSSWKGARARCRNESNHKYPSYGGRGIKFCEEWDDFFVFLGDMGERPEGMTLDRVDSDGDYCKANCRWATHEEQNRNRSSNVNLTYKGETKCMSEWSSELGIPTTTIFDRLARGDEVERALSTEYIRKSPSGKYDHKEIAGMVAGGMSPVEVSEELGCSVRTVKRAVSNNQSGEANE